MFFILTLMSVESKAQNKKYTISGKVVDSLTNRPLLGVYISVGNNGAQTNKHGEYTLKDIPVGDVILRTMYYDNFSRQFKELNLRSDTTVNFNIKNIILMDEVVVTGTRTERRLSETPILTTVINKNAIKVAGSTSMLESLTDNIPGIVVSKNGMGSNMRIKGLNSRYILFLVDGERMVSEGAGGNINLDQIDINSIEKIEMINGAASALYGSNAVGAVINVITKEPRHKFEGGVSAIGETNNTLRAGVNAGMNLKKIKATASGFRNSSDGFDIENGAYAAKYLDYGTSLKLTYKPIDRVNLTATGRYFSHETFNPENAMNVTHSFTQNINFGFNGGVVSKDNRNAFKASVNFNKFLDFEVLEKKNNEKNKDNDASYISARALNTFSPNEKWEVVAGIEYNHERNFAIETLGATPTTKTIDDANFFAQAEYEVIENFDIVAGARYTYNTQFKSALTPKLSLMYEISRFKFRGGVGTAFRAPSIKELYYDFDHQGMFWIHGNPNLKAEKGLYSSISTEYSKNYTNISVSAYYNVINNKITQYDVIDDDITNKYYKNVSSATIWGFDVSIAQTFFKQLTLKLNYSFCDAKDNSTGLQLSSNVKHSGTIAAIWSGKIFRNPFSLQMSGTLNSPRQYSEFIDDILVQTESKSYSIWKVALVVPVRIKKHTIEVSAKIDNIFNFKDVSYVNSGRQYLLGIRYFFK